MTKIEAIIRPSKLEELRKGLAPWTTGLTVSEVKGASGENRRTEVYRGAEYGVPLVAKLKVEIVVPTPLVPRVLDVVERAARTGRIGDGKVFVSSIEHAVRVRTGEEGESAL